MKASKYISNFLKDKGIRAVFVLQGGMITHLIDDIEIPVYSFHHEQAAGFAADAWAKVTNEPVVVMATSGAGAVNVVSAVANSYFDSMPVIYITGQVNSHEIRNRTRQFGFQETDIVSVVKEITKYAVQIKSVRELPNELNAAYVAATTGRPGSVLIDIPINFQYEEIS